MPLIYGAVINKAVIVDLVRLGATKTFSEYAKYVVKMDVVWEEYCHGKSEVETRSKRGGGSQTG